MQFPVYFQVFGRAVHPHLVLEVAGYTAGFQLYRWLRGRRRRALGAGAVLPFEQNVWLIAGCVFGALLGSKVLAWAESFDEYRRAAPAMWLGGKTIVGGLIGGWLGVEVAKNRLGVTRSTGDLFVFPLIVGIGVGRVGCFLTGLEDHTHGVATAWPWGVDFGDGVRRHPTQLYDVVVLVVMAAIFLVRRPGGEGRTFRAFMLGYLGWRFFAEFIKPREIRVPGVNLSAIQVASGLTAVWCAWLLWRSKTGGRDAAG